MVEKIDNIFKIESTISSLISYLYELELYDSKNMNDFKEFLKLYQIATSDEEKMFSSLSKKELEVFKVFLSNPKNKDLINYFINKNSFNPEFLPFNGRIISRITDNERHDLNVISFGSNANIESIKGVIEDVSSIVPLIVNSISAEFRDIYLSFIDEYINKVKFFAIKKRLLKEKYDIIYNTSSYHEKKLIDRGFVTDNSLYLTSELSCVSNHNDYYDIYDGARNSFISRCIASLASEIANLEKINVKEDINESEIILAYLRIRSCMLMLDINSFNKIIDKLSDDDTKLEDFGIVVDENIIDTIINDRKRHKVLSFRKK